MQTVRLFTELCTHEVVCNADIVTIKLMITFRVESYGVLYLHIPIFSLLPL